MILHINYVRTVTKEIGVACPAPFQPASAAEALHFRANIQ
jgi:hypothetical protein